MENTSKIMLPGNIQGARVFGYSTHETLEQMQREGYRPLFMPELVDVMTTVSNDHALWQIGPKSNLTPSIWATGNTKGGAAVLVYAHTANYFSDPANLKRATEQRELRDSEGAGLMPIGEFQRLVNADGMTDFNGNRLVWVLDYNTAKNANEELTRGKDIGVISTYNALENDPNTIPLLGGEQRAREFFAKDATRGGVVVACTYPLHDQPHSSLLTVGHGFMNAYTVGGVRIGSSGAFVGRKAKTSDLEKLLVA